MLGRGHVAEEVGSVLGGDGPSDGAGDVVVARRDVGHEGAENVEGSPVAEGLLHLHVGGDLVHLHVSGTLDHGLNTCLAGPLDEMTQSHQFRDLCLVGCVVDAAGSEAVPEGQGELVLLGELEQVVVVPEERVLLVVVEDPCRQE